MRLAELQRAFFAAVRARGAPPAGLEALFTASARQTATERLAVYHQAYWQRQVTVLSSTFPRVHSLLGHHFEPLALRYLERWPSSSPCIEHIGTRLPAFLGQQTGVSALARDVARLEWASQVALLAVDSRDAARLPNHLGASIADCRLQFAPSLQVECVTSVALTIFRMPANEVGKVSTEVPTSPADASEQVWVAFSRRRFAVTHVQLAPDEADALRLARAGATFGEVCEAFAALPQLDAVARATSVLSAWLGRGWITDFSKDGSHHASI